MTVLAIAGASGALGARVAIGALDAGFEVRVVARDPTRLAESVRSRATVITGDGRDRATADRLVGGADTVFSCAGASVQLGLGHGWRGYRAVDTRLNRTLVEAAAAAGRPRLVYVSVFHTPALRRLAYVDAHERVVEAITAAALPHAVLRPTGFHSAVVDAYLQLARRGRAAQIGDGAALTNPIADDDLAGLCLDAIRSDDPALVIDAGGPDLISRRAIGELAFATLGTRARFRRVPAWLARTGSAALRLLHPRIAQFARFITEVSVRDLVAPARGTTTLADSFAAHRDAARPVAATPPAA